MLRRRAPRRRASITSLIDVIFLLLLFFMLASSFTKFSEVEVMAANGMRGIHSQGSKGVQVYIEPQAVLIDDTEVLENDIAKLLNKRRTDKVLIVTIRVSREVSTQRLVDVLATLNQIPNTSFHLKGAR
ncbi:MAG: biopolymer transporter ExbD [Kordiimonadaceae bacterium]|nr:biopolymer transporter ExbD [Kordiimonadaceae bacterium]